MSKRAVTKALFRKDWFVRGARQGTLQGAETETVKQVPKRRKRVRKNKPSRGFANKLC